MKTYTDRSTAPLAFHKLICYVILPINGIIYFLSLLAAPRYLEANSQNLGVVIYYLTFFILTLISMSAITKWNKTVWYSLIGLFIGRPICNIGSFCYFGFNFFETSYIVIQVVLIISDICISLYYLKRKPLFFSSTEPQLNIKTEKESTAAASPTEAEIPNPELSKEATAENANTDDESDFYDEFDFFDEYELDSDSLDEDGLDTENSEQPFEDTVPFKLFKRIQSMAKGFCDNSTIFPYGGTLKDKEVAYIYFFFLYSNANVHHNYFDKQIFTDALAYINYTFKVVYNYTDELLETMYYTQRKKLESFITIHDEYIDSEDIEEPNLFGYTENIIAQFPNASFEDPASVDIIFAEFFYNALEDMKAFKKENSTSESTKKEEISLSSVSKVTKPIKFFCKENTPLILCIIALIGSLIGNIYQTNLNETLNQELSDLEDDYTEAVENKDYYKSSLYDLKKSYSEIISEYNFYHKYASL